MNYIDNKQVLQGNYRIIAKSNGRLMTAGLATCSAISFIMNENDVFMVHIDAKTDVEMIANQLISRYKTPIQFTHVKIWYGDGFSGTSSLHTKKLIARFTDLLGIHIKPIKEIEEDVIEHVDQNIIECRKCQAKSGTLKIIPHCYHCKYNNNVEIRTVGFMETVYS